MTRSTSPPDLTTRARRRVRRTVHASRERAAELLPLSRTTNRVPKDQAPLRPSAFACYGQGSWLVPPTRVLHPERIRIGSGCVVMEGGTLWALDEEEGADPGGGRLVLGDGVRLGRWSALISSTPGGIVLGAGVASSDGVTLLDSWVHPFASARGAAAPAAGLPQPGPVLIGDGAYLGINCVVLPGVTVGAGAFVGEGAVVTHDVAPHSVVRGNPAVAQSEHDPQTGTWRASV